MDPSAAAGDKGVATGRGGDGLMSLEEHLPLDHLSLDQLPSVAPAAGINPVAVRHCCIHRIGIVSRIIRHRRYCRSHRPILCWCATPNLTIMLLFWKFLQGGAEGAEGGGGKGDDALGEWGECYVCHLCFVF